MTNDTKPQVSGAEFKPPPFVAACEAAKRKAKLPPPNDKRDIAFLTSGRYARAGHRAGW